MKNQVPYCGITLVKIGNYYAKNIYIYVSVLISLLGVISNLFNVLVFTRKRMISSPNLIFTHLAVVDLLILLARIPYVWVCYSGFNFRSSYGWTTFKYYCIIFIVTFQFISIFLTLQMAVWRYIAVVHPLKEQHWCNMKITRNVVIVNYVTCCIMFTTSQCNMNERIKVINVNETSALYYIIRKETGLIDFYSVYYIEELMVRSLSSILLAGLTLRLVVSLLARKTYQEQLTQGEIVRNNMKNIKMRQQSNKSTIILLVVVTLYFTAEFPKGLLSLIYMMYEYDSGKCYDSLIDIFITISDFNSSVTFIVYYTLSQQFKTTFKSLFNPGSIFYQTYSSTLRNTNTKKSIKVQTDDDEV